MVAANHEEHTHKVSNTKNVLVGLLIGGLAGAAAMLLFAPQSGKRARTQIQVRTSQLRERTTELVDKGLAQVRLDTRAIAAGVREQAGQVRQIGQDELDKQLDRVSGILDAGKSAIKEA